jgi:hypothetical protein
VAENRVSYFFLRDEKSAIGNPEGVKQERGPVKYYPYFAFCYFSFILTKDEKDKISSKNPKLENIGAKIPDKYFFGKISPDKNRT